MHYLGAIGIGIGALTGSLADKDPFVQEMHSKVIETIEHSEQVPGLQSEAFYSITMGIEERWTELVEKEVLEITATDQEARPYFVALQGIVEHVLAHELGKSVHALTGVIHTPMPATPLCTKGHVSANLVDPSIEADPLRLFTVKARATILRDYLAHGGHLYIVYPKEGLFKRTEMQQHIYQKELENNPTNLFDRPLDCASIPQDFVGAFYVFKNTQGKWFAFAIQMTQANQPQDVGHFGLWFGEVSSTSPVKERITHVLDHILKDSSQPIPVPAFQG